MLTGFGLRQMKGFVLKPVSARMMCTAAIKDKFEQAWMENAQSHTVKEHKVNNLQEYGAGYYQRHHMRMKKGYTHPYHSEEHPISFLSIRKGLELASDFLGTEQVSPHYESLSRSRRGLIFLFLYIGTITSVARMGGWEHNEWIRGLVFHHEYLIALYAGYAELRHFTWIPGPKFTIFYDVYSRYESSQLASQWNDTSEELSTQFYQNTKNQVDYMRIHNEYKFIKKRAMVNYLTNERLNLEKHFHDRTLGMLNNISAFEKQNLKNKLNSVTQAAFDATLKKVETDIDQIREQAFKGALEGIRKGRMDFSSDPVLPIMAEELATRIAELRALTPEQESKLLSLSDEQKKGVIQSDRTVRDTYLSAVPHLSSQGLKSHHKFLKFADHLASINK
jgi:hypothetical protein